MNARPSVSVIVPFAGSAGQLASLLTALARLATSEHDEILVADNRPAGVAGLAGLARVPGVASQGPVRIIAAAGVAAPGFARNCAAAVATGDWLLFLDADTEPAGDLLDRYFDPAPRERTAILAGAIVDRPGGGRVSAAIAARGAMSQAVTLRRAGTPYAQTANCAVRRTAFAAVGGFDTGARWGEDADLCFRLFQKGWGVIEERPGAVAVHRARPTINGWLAQLAGHGTGAAWLGARYPGEFPAVGACGVTRRGAVAVASALRAVRSGRFAQAGAAALDLPAAVAFELGRHRTNRPRRAE